MGELKLTTHKRAEHKRIEGGATLYFKVTTVYVWYPPRNKDTTGVHTFYFPHWIDTLDLRAALNASWGKK